MLACFLGLALTIGAVPAALAADPQTDDQKTLYSIGYSLSRQLSSYNLKPEEIEFVKDGLAEGLANKPAKVDPQQFAPKIQQFVKDRMTAAAEVEKKKGAEYLAKAATEKGADKLPSGVIYFEQKAGTGDSPKATDKVKVNYRGTLLDGTEFDSSYKRNQPAEFPLNGVIKCWTEGVQKMKPGGKAKLVCPSDTAYGDRGAPPHIKPGSTLIFEVELLEVAASTPPTTNPLAK